MLMSKLCLFVGMSEKTAKDYLLSPLLQKLAREVAKASRPTGFWLFGRGVATEVVTHLKDRNVVPLVLEGYEDVAKFL